jgi:acyl phosphate:glycerol-3-phosphate acyltransferase
MEQVKYLISGVHRDALESRRHVRKSAAVGGDLRLDMAWVEQLGSTNWTEPWAIAFGAYILGCFTTGYYLVRWRRGTDLRELGSGSVGARNVGRILGWKGFLIVLGGDLGKGAFAVWAARHFTADLELLALGLLAVVAGHIWPAPLRFRGGKGVATSLGGLLIYDFHLALAFAFLFVASLLFVRRTVLPGLFAFACLPLASLYLNRSPSEAFELSILAGLILFAHRKNLSEEFGRVIQRRQIHPKHHPPDL